MRAAAIPAKVATKMIALAMLLTLTSCGSGGGGSSSSGGNTNTPSTPSTTCSGATIQSTARNFELAVQDNATKCMPVTMQVFANDISEAKQCIQSQNPGTTAFDPLTEVCDIAFRRLLNGQCMNHFVTVNRNYNDAVTCDRNTLCGNCTHVNMTSSYVISTYPGTCRAREVTTSALTCQ